MRRRITTLPQFSLIATSRLISAISPIALSAQSLRRSPMLAEAIQISPSEQNKSRQLCRWFAVCALLIFLSGVARGQVAPGMPNFSAYDSYEVDTVNLMNNNIILHIPVMSKSGAMGFNYALTGGSYEAVVGTSPTWEASMTGISLGGPLRGSANGVVAGGVTSYATPTVSVSANCPGGGSTTKFMNWVVRFVDGTVHPLPPGDYIDTYGANLSCLNSSFTDTTTDGSGLTVNVTHNGPASIYTRSGMSISSNAVTDSNGNSISWSGSGSYTLRDTLGLTAITTYELSLTASTYTWTDVKLGSPQVAATSSGLVNVRSAFGCSGVSDYNTTDELQSGFTFPDGTSLGLTYEITPGFSPDVTGRINTITLREGGTVAYTYGGPNNGINCTYQTVPVLTRIQGNGDKTTYTLMYSMIGTGPNYEATNTVVDPGGNQTAYTFTGFSATGSNPATAQLLTQVQRYQGNGSTAVLLATDVYCYNGLTANCQSTTNAAGPITEVDVYHTIAGMSSPSRTQTLFDVYGNVTQFAQYDFGGINAKLTYISYGSWSASTSSCIPIGNYIYDKPCAISVNQPHNEIATTVAGSLFTYDAHGNLTLTSLWTGQSTGRQHYPVYIGQTSQNTYNLNGTPITTYDLANNPTSYIYDSTKYAHCTSCTQYPFPTSITRGGLTTSSTWDGIGGVKLTDVDANLNKTIYGYINSGGTADPFWRTRQITDPYGTIDWRDYWATGSADYILFNSSQSVVNPVTNVDGYGRVYSKQMETGPNTSTYDTVGISYGWSTNYFTISTSQPCDTTLGGSCPTVHTNEFDPLGRLVSKVTTSNELLTNSYSQNDILTQLAPAPSGENVKEVQTEYDGVGRQTSSCAISSAASGVVSCGQNTNTSLTGVLTKTSYSSALGSTIVTVTRGGQTRSRTYDGLGRLEWETNPESSGVPPTILTVYIYDSDSYCNQPALGLQSPSNGDLISKTDANGNKICYSYDSLHRLTDAVPFKNGVCYGPVKRFRYDSTGNSILPQPSGYSGGNLGGRMLEAWTGDCVWPTPASGSDSATDEWFSYDKDGRMTDLWESTSHVLGYFHGTTSYAGNGSVISVGGVPGYTAITYGLDGEGRPNTATQGTTRLVTGVNYNPSSQPHNIFIGAGDSDNYAYDPNTGRMTNYTFTVGSTPKSQIGSLTWNQNGTLRTLAITDGFNSGGAQTCNYGTASVPGYDDLGRLLNVKCGSALSETYSYDQYDNITQSGSFSWVPGYDQTTNHALSPMTYDSNGNMTHDASHAYGWYIDNKLGSTDSTTCNIFGSSDGTCVLYDALGREVEQGINGNYLEIMYTPVGKTAIMSNETTTQSAYFPLPGGATLYETGSSGGNQYFWHKDWLGSVRLSSTIGNRTVYFDRAFAPYGQSYNNFGNAAGFNFTGDTQDSFLGLYDTPNREYHPGEGRWLSPDPSQTGWNHYAYVTNPNNFSDPLGLAPVACKVVGGCSEGQTNYGGGYIDALSGWVSSFGQFFTNGTVGADNGYISPGDPLGPPVDNGNDGTTTAANDGTVHPLYQGIFSCNADAQGVMQQVEGNFSQFANYQGSFSALGIPVSASASFFPGTVEQGSTINIQNVNSLGNSSPGGSAFFTQVNGVSVKVRSVSPTSFTFATNPGHIVYPASITFSAADAGSGQIQFSIQINGDFANLTANALYRYLGGQQLENNIWNNFLNNIQRVCHSSGKQ